MKDKIDPYYEVLFTELNKTTQALDAMLEAREHNEKAYHLMRGTMAGVERTGFGKALDRLDQTIAYLKVKKGLLTKRVAEFS